MEVAGSGRWEGRAAVARRLAQEMARTKGKIAVIGRVLQVSFCETEVAFAGNWLPMGASAESARDSRLAGRRASAPGGGGGGELALEPSACVLERVEWTDAAGEFAQRRVRKITRMPLQFLHPELREDWRQVRLRALGPRDGAGDAQRGAVGTGASRRDVRYA
mmetsp:Transcript_37834/g.88872  ORF Transcript_37834/g.88872 Transcript_37834/m.88872 type:complete len:163 (+) Transcript_37834:3258-3746(+)